MSAKVSRADKHALVRCFASAFMKGWVALPQRKQRRQVTPSLELQLYHFRLSVLVDVLLLTDGVTHALGKEVRFIWQYFQTIC